MNKNLLLLVFTIVFVNATNAQSDYGISAGYHNPVAEISGDGFSISNGISGFYIGVFKNIKTSEKIHIQPELQFSYADENGADLKQLILPVMLKYYLAEGINAQLGFLADYVLNEDATNRFGFGVAIGGSYEFTEKFFIITKYSFGLNSRSDDIDPNFNFTSRLNIFQIGLNYRL